MKDLPDWDKVWVPVRGWLTQVADLVVAAHPRMRSIVSRMANEVFPFSCSLSLVPSGEPRADERAVVSVEAQIRGEELRLTADVARGNGDVLADGPTVDIPLVDASEGLETALASWMNALQHFILDEAPRILLSDLNEAAPS